MTKKPNTTSVLFVCLGNICRSPMAEAVFLETIGRLEGPGDPKEPTAHDKYSFIDEVDSAGTGAYHVGSMPDRRTLRTLEAHDVKGYVHAARKVSDKDFENFDYIFGMDAENVEDLMDVRERVRRRIGKKSSEKEEKGLAKVLLYGEMGGRGMEDVVDPYYGGDEGFETCYEQMVRFSKGFLAHVEKERGASL